MTTLISWITFDQSKQSSLYVASDSRLSSNRRCSWDLGRKIYCSSKYPDILGYCGDVVFCSQTISQVMTYIDSCDVFEDKLSPKDRFSFIFDLIKRSFGIYPQQFALNNFQIIYATREKKYEFHAFLMSWDKVKGWVEEKLNIPKTTGIILASGSGGDHYKAKYKDEFKYSDIGGLSRSYYSCLYSHIKSKNDPLTGGPIQISGLFTVGPATIYGVLMDGQRYIYGMEVDSTQNINNVKWVNENFENCDGKVKKRLETAQPQPLPQKKCKPLGKGTQRIPFPR